MVQHSSTFTMLLLDQNPILPEKTLKLMVTVYKVGGGTGLLPWGLEPETETRLLVNRTGRWTAWFGTLNLVYPYLIFGVTALLNFYGIVFQGWGQIQIMFGIMSLGLMFSPIMVGSVLIKDASGVAASARESLKHVQFLGGFFRSNAPSPVLVSRSHLAMELVILMTYSNTVSAALMTLLIPWLPLAMSNFVQLAFGIRLTGVWKGVAKLMDFVIVMYGGHQCAIIGMVLISTLHSFSICNNAVLKELMGSSKKKKPSLIKLRSSERNFVIVKIFRRIQLLNIGIGETFSLFTFMSQTLIILVASTSIFGAIKLEGLVGVCLGVVGVFFVVINIGYLTYCSMWGERMSQIKAELERECRSHPLLRRQVRCMRPAYMSVGSFYHVDKGCILTCCMLIVNNVLNALIMTTEP